MVSIVWTPLRPIFDRRAVRGVERHAGQASGARQHAIYMCITAPVEL